MAWRMLALPFLLLALAVSAPGVLAKTYKSKLHDFTVRVLTDELDEPWGFAFLPDGSILFTEKEGTLRQLKAGILSGAISGVPKVASSGQGGLLDVAIDPEFATNRQIYLTLSEPRKGGTGTAVVRAVLAGGALDNVQVIFRQNRTTPGARHFGSRIAFAPDGTLFFTIGDRGKRFSAQDPKDHAGSVLRINKDGSVPADNPFADGKEALPEIWSIGHRNPQGIVIHPDSGNVWTVAHGARGGDEINTPEAGKNYGWPIISYGRHYSGRKIGEGTAKAGLEQPRHYWDPSIAPSSLAFYSGGLFPKWKGNMFVSALAGQQLVRVVLDGNKVVAEEPFLVEAFGRIRRVNSGPDGALYAITDDGAFLRLSPAKPQS